MDTHRVTTSTIPKTRTEAIGVVLPVHNEEELLQRALEAIEEAFSHVAHVVARCRTAVVLDHCSDASSSIALEWVRKLRRRGGPHQATTRTCRSACVGDARRTGMSALLRDWVDTDPARIWLATTDADSRVPGGWLAAQRAAHEAGADLWAGRVAIDDWSLYQRTTSLRWTEAYDAEASPIHGANLGFNAQLYLAAGGFTPLATSEDRTLYDAIVKLGARPHEDPDVKVITSGRRHARAPLGFSHRLGTLEEDVLAATSSEYPISKELSGCGH